MFSTIMFANQLQDSGDPWLVLVISLSCFIMFTNQLQDYVDSWLVIVISLCWFITFYSYHGCNSARFWWPNGKTIYYGDSRLVMVISFCWFIMFTANMFTHQLQDYVGPWLVMVISLCWFIIGELLFFAFVFGVLLFLPLCLPWSLYCCCYFRR